jgi:phosphoribosyl 1,2-cyclic phosphodiesterase
MSIQFTVLASGSRGNASLVQSGQAGMLIDFGVGPRDLDARLQGVGSGLGRIGSVVLTHTHGDHVHPATLRLMARWKIPLYCHEGHRLRLGEKPGFRELDAAGLIRHYDDRPFLAPTGQRIEPVPLSHDGGPTFGFRIEMRADRGRRPVSVGYLADTGCWTEATADAMTDVDVLGVEFNHDVAMQKQSGRAPYLIARNLGPRGHLSNVQGSSLVGSVLGRSCPGTVRHLILLHLSEHCNRPGLAIGTARETVRSTGRRVAIHAARQGQVYPDLRVRPAPRRRPVAGARAAAPGFPWEDE